jgi:transcriptional regulator with XRE-family HTH domain
MDMTEIGVLLREARKNARRTQADLAQSLRMSRATISAIENGTVNEIGVRKLRSLCAAETVPPATAPHLVRTKLVIWTNQPRKCLSASPPA